MGRCLGLIGGLGVGATVHYYRALAQAYEQREEPLRLLMAHADVNRVLAYVQAKETDELTDYLAALIEQLERGGAEIAAISAVTPHVCIRELAARSPLPLINLLDVAREAIGGKRVALFGTRFTVETDLFGALEGKHIVRPEPREVVQIHEAYVGTARRGEGGEEERRVLTAIARRLMEGERVELLSWRARISVCFSTKRMPPFRLLTARNCTSTRL